MPGQREQRRTPRLTRTRRAFSRHLARRAGSAPLRTRADELAIHSVRDGGRQILAARGHLDLANAWRFEQELRRAEASDAREILLDLGGVEFIDAVGMEVVIHATARSRHHSKTLMILSGPSHVHRSFEVSGLVARLPFVPRHAGVPLP